MTTSEATRARTALCELGDPELHARTRGLVGDERSLVLALLLHLDEIDRRRSYDGCRSLWDYCVERLRLPESQIFLRTKAVRLIRRFPEAIPRLRDGRLNLSTLVALRRALTSKNATTLFDAVEGKTKKEAVAIAAMAKARVIEWSSVRAVPPEIVPVPEAIARMRQEEARRDGGAGSGDPEGGYEAVAHDAKPTASSPGVAELSPTASSSSLTEGPLLAAPPGTSESTAAWLVFGGEDIRELRPVSATQCQVTFTAPIEFRRELEELRDGLSHVIPDGDLARLLQYAVREVLTRLRKKSGTIPVRERKTAKLPATSSASAEAVTPQAEATAVEPANAVPAGGATAATPEPGSRVARPDPAPPPGARPATPPEDHAATRRGRRGREPISTSLRRLVLQRDKGRCSICGSTWQVEIDHIVPVALGGENTPSNLRSVCKRHNLEAERDVFGEAFVDRKIQASRARATLTRSGRDPPEEG